MLPPRAVVVVCAAAGLLLVGAAAASDGSGSASGSGSGSGTGTGTGTGGGAAAPAMYQTTVRGKLPTPRRPGDDPTGMTTVIDTRRDSAAGQDLRDVLARVPGVRVKDSGPSGMQRLSMRGSASHQVVIELDGVRLTPAGGGSVDLSLIDPAHVARVEVRRSGGSARFGSGALGGVLVLRTPRLRSRRRTSLSLGYGAFGTLRARASHGQRLGRRTRVLAAVSYRQTDGDFRYVDESGRSRVRPNNDARVVETLAKVDRIISARWHAGAMVRFVGAERGAPGLAQRESGTARQLGLDGLAALRLTRWDLLLRRSKLTLTLRQRYGYFRYRETAPPQVLTRNHRSGTGVGARWELPLGRTGRLDVGADVRFELLRDADSGGLVEAVSPDRVSAALWAASQTRLFGSVLVVAPAVRVIAVSDFGVTVVPKVGLIVRPLRRAGVSWLRQLEVVGNIGRRYRVPSFSEMYIRLDGFGSNPDLRPEDALAGDVGLRWRATRRLAVEVAYFRRFLRNTILFAPQSPTLVRAENYARIDAQGLEATLTLRPGLCVALAASYTLTRTRFDRSLRMPGQPRHRAVGRAGWSGARCSARWRRRSALGHVLGGLELHAGVVVESEMALDRFNNIVEEGRVLLSAGGAYRWRFLRLAAEGRNLLDKRDAVDTVGFPLAPARFFVSLSASF